MGLEGYGFALDVSQRAHSLAKAVQKGIWFGLRGNPEDPMEPALVLRPRDGRPDQSSSDQ
jgi:hypothetical protein